MTIEQIMHMKTADLERWNWESLDLAEDTKVLLQIALAKGAELREGTKMYLNDDSKTEIYTVYMKRQMGKGKGDDLINDVCPIFEPALKISEQVFGSNSPLVDDFRKKYDTFYHIRKQNGYTHEKVRAVYIDDKKVKALNATAGKALLLDYNVMIFTILKTKADACHIENGIANYPEYLNILQTHFQTEQRVVSNCVDVPIFPLITENRDEYFLYLREGVDALMALAQSAIECMKEFV